MTCAPYQLIALPDWADTARFDVAATASFTASPQQMNSMLQGLLADRFDLVCIAIGVSFRFMRSYLRDATEDWTQAFIPRLDCESTAAKPLDSGTAQADYAGCTPQMGLTRLKAPGFRLSGIASMLMRILDRPVIDKTGLSGAFDIELSWTPDPTMLPNGVPAPTTLPSGAASIFTALVEQLGLRLSDGAPVDVLVIDRIDRLKPD